jgi:membrane-associated phospholipid phosphatase
MSPRTDPESTRARLVALFYNVVIVLGLYGIYEYTRGLVHPNSSVALSHAHEVWSWETSHGLFVEPAWQKFWLTQAHILGWLTPRRVENFLDTGYLYVHFMGTIVFLFWLYFRRRRIFAVVRNIFFLTTSIALATYILYPLAPPRLATNLFYDNHKYVFLDPLGKILGTMPQSAEFGYNPYAAMPSLHFGWALIIGCTLFLTLRRWPLRFLALCYPLFMLSVIVISGNHFFADAIGSAVVVSFSASAVIFCHRLRGTLPWSWGTKRANVAD